MQWPRIYNALIQIHMQSESYPNSLSNIYFNIWTAGQSQVQTPTPLGMHNCTTQTIHCFPSTCRRSKTMIALVLVKRYWSFQKSNIISQQKYNAFKYKIISMVRLWKKKNWHTLHTDKVVEYIYILHTAQ